MFACHTSRAAPRRLVLILSKFMVGHLNLGFNHDAALSFLRPSTAALGTNRSPETLGLAAAYDFSPHSAYRNTCRVGMESGRKTPHAYEAGDLGI
jgi:hypothetical protein